MMKNILTIQFAAICLIASLFSCKKLVPTERETIGDDSRFNNVLYKPILGRTTIFTDNFYKGSTSYPTEFKIVEHRKSNGDPAPELTDVFPVKVWKDAYTGKEKTLEEIEAKREIQYRTLFEIGKHSGSLTLRAEARSAFMRSLPDSGYKFDIEVSNSGGRRYFRGLRLQPFKERPFEPSTYDELTGQALGSSIPVQAVGNIYADSLGRYLSSSEILVIIRKIIDEKKPAGNTLTFKMLDKNYRPINPDKFNKTDWPTVVHGFNMKKTETSVTFDVAYPVPLVSYPTYFTNGVGDRASVTLGYSRKGAGGRIQNSFIQQSFAIYEAGDWEILFVFKADNPKFADD